MEFALAQRLVVLWRCVARRWADGGVGEGGLLGVVGRGNGDAFWEA